MKYWKKMVSYWGGFCETVFDTAFFLIPGSSALLGAASHRVYEATPSVNDPSPASKPSVPL